MTKHVQSFDYKFIYRDAAIKGVFYPFRNSLVRVGQAGKDSSQPKLWITAKYGPFIFNPKNLPTQWWVPIS